MLSTLSTLYIASVFKKTQTLKVLDSVPGMYPYSEIGQNIQSLCVTLFWTSQRESYCRKMIALTVISPNRSQGLFTSISSTAITQGKKENSPLWASCSLEPSLSSSNVLNHPNLTLFASHLENNTAFTLWQSKGLGHNISVC